MTISVANPHCMLPDRTVALPARNFEISPAGKAEADRLRRLPLNELFHRLVRDQESDAALLTCRRLVDSFLGGLPDPAIGIAEIPALVEAARAELAPMVAGFAELPTEIRQLVYRQRAPLALLDGCWLDTVSQPATQPAILVNRLYAQHYAQRGAGKPMHAQEFRRRRALEATDIALPPIGAHDFLARADVRPLTALHACWYLALSRLPANFLPEVAAVQFAFRMIGIDDLLLGSQPTLPTEALTALLAEFTELATPAACTRFVRAVRLVIDLEREHLGMLTNLARWRSELSLESRVAEIISRHAKLAGRQHGRVSVDGRRLSETFTDSELDLADFLGRFRESPYVNRGHDGSSPFTTAMKFGGPMFGIFDDQEAAVFRSWVASVQAGNRPAIEISPCTAGDEAARRWLRRFAESEPADVVIAAPAELDDRELFFRLINIENFPNTLARAAERVRRNLSAAEVLFVHGAAGRYTDASYFDYTPQAVYERGKRVYWEKLVDPYRALVGIPDRDEVIFTQCTYALGYLIDGAWLHKIGNTGHFERESDHMLFAIHADEMGHGDLVKNHLTLTHRVLHSLGIDLPHIRTEAFMDQADLPDDLYGFSLHLLIMCLLPDTFYNELLGYNLAVEMFGSGELRLHEIQKLRHHGFDICYEQAHLTIDNFSAGHAKQAADIIVSYLDDVRRTAGEDVVQQEWRRIWRGYASLALFVEHALLKQLANTPSAPAASEPLANLLI
ncbi:MAG: iron-containing redox enzyme family protein [Jatrophihabitantaceae bacterium]